eukprot:c18349_g1_i1.p1 GENE.c18349_g1_i1~~c18349_g1_i1.p1  ORF type:complete len:221 (+),score=32.38 c18349_g1_i1:23-664(+)
MSRGVPFAIAFGATLLLTKAQAESEMQEQGPSQPEVAQRQLEAKERNLQQEDEARMIREQEAKDALQRSTVYQLGLNPDPDTKYYISIASGARLEAHCDGSSQNIGMRSPNGNSDQKFTFEDGEVAGKVRIRTGRGSYVEANCSGNSAGSRSFRSYNSDQLLSMERVSSGVYRITCGGRALEGDCTGDSGGGRIVGMRRIGESQDQYFHVRQA